MGWSQSSVLLVAMVCLAEVTSTRALKLPRLDISHFLNFNINNNNNNNNKQITITLGVTDTTGTPSYVESIKTLFTNDDEYEDSTVESAAATYTPDSPIPVAANASSDSTGFTNLEVPAPQLDEENCCLYTHLCAVITPGVVNEDDACVDIRDQIDCGVTCGAKPNKDMMFVYLLFSTWMVIYLISYIGNI